MYVANGDVFRWNWLWRKLADWFHVEPVGFEGEIHPLDVEMSNYAPLWKQMAEKFGLKVADLSRLSSAWHTDLDLGRPIEVMTDMSKSRKSGFTVYQDTRDSFYDLFETLRSERLIP